MVQEWSASDTGQNLCSNCGRDMLPNVRFCPHCGQRTASSPGSCAHCGSSIRAGVGFCPNCGIATDVTPVQTPGEGSVVVDMAAVDYMGFRIRFIAWIIDFIILSVVQVVVSLIGLPLVNFFIGPFYGVLFIGLKGQTPGKMAMGIQVVNQQGQIPGIGRAALREIIGKLVSGVAVGLGYAWIGWDRQKRGWHDHIGGTFVVRKRRERL